MTLTIVNPVLKMMNRFMMANVVAERAKAIQNGARPLIEASGGKFRRALDVAYEEVRRGLIHVEPAKILPVESHGTEKKGGNGLTTDEE